MAGQFFYSSPAVTSAIANPGGLSASGTSVELATIAGYPLQYPFRLLLDWGKANQETVTAVSAPAGTGAGRIIVPAYSYPNPPLLWNALNNAGSAAVSCVIVNVASGPGVTADPNFTAAIAAANAAGLTLAGYVDTNYTAVTTGTVSTNIGLWNSLYGITNIFFDRASATTGAALTYYTTVCGYVTGPVKVLNHGTIPDAGYAAIASVNIVYEDVQANWAAFTPAGWMSSHPPSQFAALVYAASGAPVMNSVVTEALAYGIGNVYVTDETGADPYTQLPSYWSSEIPAATSPGPYTYANCLRGQDGTTGTVHGYGAQVNHGVSSSDYYQTRPVFNPCAIGADPTGAQDSTTAISNTLANARVTGGRTRLPAGTYAISGALGLESGDDIAGDGSATTILQMTSTTANVLTIAETALADIHVSGLRINGPGSGTGQGIYVSANAGAAAATRIRFDDVIVNGMGSHGVNAQNLLASQLTGVLSQYNGGRGIYLNSGAAISLKNCWAYGNAAERGIYLYSVQASVVEACAADANALGIELYSCTGCTVISPESTGTVKGASGLDGSSVKVNGGSGNKVQGAYVVANAAIGVYFTGSCTGCALEGAYETAAAGATASVQVDVTSQVTVSGGLNVTTPPLFAVGTPWDTRRLSAVLTEPFTSITGTAQQIVYGMESYLEPGFYEIRGWFPYTGAGTVGSTQTFAFTFGGTTSTGTVIAWQNHAAAYAAPAVSATLTTGFTTPTITASLYYMEVTATINVTAAGYLVLTTQSTVSGDEIVIEAGATLDVFPVLT